MFPAMKSAEKTSKQGKELTLFREKCKEAFRNQLEEYLKQQKRCAREGSVFINITTEHVVL